MGKSTARGSGSPKAIIGYVRVSTERQRQNGISLDAQRAAIREFARKSGLPLIEIFEDVASGAGSKSIPSRLGLQNALQACRDNDGLLVVWDWSRLSRHAESSKDLRSLVPAPGRVLSLKENEELDSAIKNARIVHAQYERDETSRRTKEGMARRKEQGAVFGNPKITSIQRSGTAAASEKTEAIIREIVEFLNSVPDSSSITGQKVCDHLNAKGIRSGHGNEWNVSRIKTPLRKARDILDKDAAENQAIYEKNPQFGIF